MSKLLKISVSVVGVALALGTAASAFAYTFTAAPLTVGSRGADVQALQVLLNSNTATQVAATGAGSPGNETTYFGNLTKMALAKYQAANGISPAAGYFGPITEAFVNNLKTTTTTTTTGGTTVVSTASGVTASLAADNTPSGSVVAGSARAELARFNFVGNGVVTNLTLQQIGLSAYNSTLQNVYLYSGATRLTDSGSVSSNGTVTFNAPAGLFTVNGSQEITIRADLVPTAQAGQTAGTVGIELTGFTVGGVNASVGISGNQQVIVNTTAATAAFTQAVSNPASGATVQTGTTNFTIWSNTLQVSTRAVTLNSAAFRFIGSAPASALTNIKLYVDGTQVGNTGSIAAISGTSYITFDLSATPFVVTTGSHTLEVRADIIGGASYSFTVSLQNAADLALQDSQLPGTYVAVAGIPSNTFGNSVTIQQGSNSVTVDPNFTTTTVTGGATNVPIAQYVFSGYGENVKILSLNVTPSISGGTPSGSSLNNVALYANGAQVGSTMNFTGSTLTFNLGSSLVVPAGQTVILTVKADLINATSTNYTAGNLTVALAGTVGNAQGLSSQQVLTIPGSTVNGVQTPGTVTSNQLSIGSNNITVAENASLTNQSVSPNTAATKIGSYVIQAGSAEGLQVTGITVGVTSSAGITNLANLKIVGNGINVVPVNPQTTNNFSTNFTIPTSQSQTVDVYADVGALTGSATTTLTVTGRGIVSNVSTTTAATTGQTITIAQGGVTSAPSIVSSATLPSQFIIGPSSPAVATYQIISTSTTASIQELRFQVTSGTVSQLAISANGQTVTTPVVGTLADFTGMSLAIPAGYGGINLTITPTYTTVNGTNGIASNSTSTINLIGIMSRSGNSTTYLGTTKSGSNGSLSVTGEQPMYLVSSKPTLAINTGSVSGLTNGQVEVGDITVSADQNGNINVEHLPISVTTAGAVNFASQALVIKDANNNNINIASGTLPTIAAGATGTTTISFSNGYPINAGTPQTFRIFATAQGSSGSAGTQSVTTAIGAQSLFTWDDINGNKTGITGQYITNFPTGSHSITN